MASNKADPVTAQVLYRLNTDNVVSESKPLVNAVFLEVVLRALPLVRLQGRPDPDHPRDTLFSIENAIRKAVTRIDIQKCAADNGTDEATINRITGSIIYRIDDMDVIDTPRRSQDGPSSAAPGIQKDSDDWGASSKFGDVADWPKSIPQLSLKLTQMYEESLNGRESHDQDQVNVSVKDLHALREGVGLLNDRINGLYTNLVRNIPEHERPEFVLEEWFQSQSGPPKEPNEADAPEHSPAVGEGNAARLSSTDSAPQPVHKSSKAAGKQPLYRSTRPQLAVQTQADTSSTDPDSTSTSGSLPGPSHGGMPPPLPKTRLAPVTNNQASSDDASEASSSTQKHDLIRSPGNSPTKKKAKEDYEEDVGKLRPPTTALNLFFATEGPRPRFEDAPVSLTEGSKQKSLLTKIWHKMSDAEREPFEKLIAQDHKRYAIQQEALRNGLKYEDLADNATTERLVREARAIPRCKTILDAVFISFDSQSSTPLSSAGGSNEQQSQSQEHQHQHRPLQPGPVQRLQNEQLRGRVEVLKSTRPVLRSRSSSASSTDSIMAKIRKTRANIQEKIAESRRSASVPTYDPHADAHRPRRAVSDDYYYDTSADGDGDGDGAAAAPAAKTSLSSLMAPKVKKEEEEKYDAEEEARQAEVASHTAAAGSLCPPDATSTASSSLVAPSSVVSPTLAVVAAREKRRKSKGLGKGKEPVAGGESDSTST